MPSSRKNEIRGVVDGALKVSVTAAAEKGKANAAIIKLLSKKLQIAKSQIVLNCGTTSSVKRFVLLGVEMTPIEKQLTALIADKH